MKRLSLCIIALALSLPAQALVTQTYNKYLGRDGNWFEAANWSLGHVPTAEEDVLIDGDSHVVIDPALGSGGARRLRDLLIGGQATLETMPGVVLQTRNEVIRDGGRLIHRSSASKVEGTLVNDGGTLQLNPTPKIIRTVVLQSSFVNFGLGGREPAAIVKELTGTLVLSGQGYYSTLTADVVVLGGDSSRKFIQIDGRTNSPSPASGTPARNTVRVQGSGASALPAPPLRLSLHYGFVPRAGDTFQIITANQLLIGQFPGMPEGALIGCTENDLGFYISYVGGDGNDVVLTTRDASRGDCAAATAGYYFRVVVVDQAGN